MVTYTRRRQIQSEQGLTKHHGRVQRITCTGVHAVIMLVHWAATEYPEKQDRRCVLLRANKISKAFFQVTLLNIVD